jgi:hypothetical protein
MALSLTTRLPRARSRQDGDGLGCLELEAWSRGGGVSARTALHRLGAAAPSRIKIGELGLHCGG